ncbi:hypothetical protein HHK36_010919 [Tetracentron sinense]|uniref:DUF4378 domain-containing protein n=1 Tax=Tetracentron sinense TaxID=13715 RepID=A0A835DFR6_TETSI|nr:hypothetical protein HHK36_010919 [Tetracentron sinense]
MESKRHQPSVIARLMGLDALPPKPAAHKKQNFSSENHLQRAASVGFQEKSSFYEGRSFRKSVEQQQEFKDVFEVLETSKVKENYPSVLEGTENSKLTEARMEIVIQKFMDAKCLSMDERLQYSKEFHDALQVLNSNKDILLKFLQEPDSLFTKHLRDLQGFPPHSQPDHITVLKPSNAPEFENIDMRRGSERKTKPSDAINSLQKHDNCLLTHSYCKHGVHNSHKLSKSRFKGKDEPCLLPTRIVVLKPDLGKARNAARSLSSPISSESFQSSYTKQREYSNCGNGDLLAEVQVTKNSSNDMELLRHRSRGSREIAKEIIRQMRQSISSGSIKVSRSGSRGYTGDESSCNISKKDSANESDVVTLTSRNSSDWKNHYSPSSSYSTESSVSREAKKRLSERWKMTHRVQEAGLVGKGRTLREMLVMLDRETRPTNLDSVIGHDGPGDRFSGQEGGARWGSVLGISSRDGMKDGYARNIPRFGSLRPSTAFRSPKTSIRHVALGDERCMFQESINQGHEEFRKGNSDQKDDPFPKIIRSNSKKSQFSFSVDKDNDHIVQEIHPTLDELRNNLDMKNLSEEKPMVPKLYSGNAADTGFIADVVGDAEPVGVAMSSETPEEKLSDSTECVLIVKDGDFSGHDPDDSIPQESIGNSEESSSLFHCPVPEPESSASSKEADQPSWVSVLESPFVGEISSGSECFERVSADLHGLRMQLQLLKLEFSETYTEGFGMIVSSDEDIGELPEEKGELRGMFKAEEHTDSSYLNDVLVESGFQCAGLEMGMATCYSPECPVDLLVFEKLEKKYCEQTYWPRSERRLLFDRINLGLTEILRMYMGPHWWVKPISERVGLRWHEETLEEQLWKLLVKQGMEVREESAEKVMGREVNFLEFGDEINLIGGEIERLLMDELVQEIMSL